MKLAPSLVAALLALPSLASAQLRHRRPVAGAPDIRYGFDNNSGGGCRDYTCGSRCYDGHSGTDIPVPVGTSVLASADGTVTAVNNTCADVGYVGNPCGGRCGNYVQLAHADGSRTIYCHMQRNSFRVSNGQRVRCGQELGRSASSGSSSGPHLHFGWRRTASSASQDPFRGRCASGPVVWTEQRPYPGIPAANCACTPSTETCNNRDDDCDGRVDDGLSRSCYTGPAGTSGRGACRAGNETCAAGRWGACAGQVVPRAETCNRVDDDCDGMVDEGACATDAGTRPDVPMDRPAVTDTGPRDAPSDRADEALDAEAPPDAEAPLDAEAPPDAAEDASDDAAEDVVEEPVFDDVIPEDVDVSPDREDPQEGCGCSAPGARGRGVGEVLAALAVGAFARRRRALGPKGAALPAAHGR